MGQGTNEKQVFECPMCEVSVVCAGITPGHSESHEKHMKRAYNKLGTHLRNWLIARCSAHARQALLGCCSTDRFLPLAPLQSSLRVSRSSLARRRVQPCERARGVGLAHQVRRMSEGIERWWTLDDATNIVKASLNRIT